MSELLSIEGLSIRLGGTRSVALVDDVSFAIAPGEAVGIVGESGSGKSLTCLATMGLVPRALSSTGEIRFEGRPLAGMSEAQLRAYRGNGAAMIFQEPGSSLNPILTIGTQLAEAIRHSGLKEKAAVLDRAVELLQLVGINEPSQRLRQYPYELSGGMLQRVMIAIALAGRPKLLVGDEPTTALDVTIQAQILELVAQLVTDLGMALLLVSHDLGVIAQACRRTLVMYGGRIVEAGDTHEVLVNPTHPYTSALLTALPSLDGPIQDLTPIPGTVPTADAMPQGCRFHPRCPLAVERCRVEVPPLLPTGGTNVACWVRGAQVDDRATA
ncbi:MAG TPA: ABC transporter ATP-binding protein [Propionibacteriaceae bacterium]|nr:ABC transporter ATP-binding protein [Propionibacteriaceae bacterium]